MKNRAVLFVGIERDKSGGQLNAFQRARALTALRKDAAQTFGGYTLQNVEGGWTNEAGKLIEEAGVRLDIYTDKLLPTVHAFARRTADLFNQSSVLLDYTDGPVEFRAFVEGVNENNYTDSRIAAIV